MNRFDDCVRTERYFTATLLPLVLFHNEFSGLRGLVNLIEAGGDSEHDRDGKKCPRENPNCDYSDPEIITEFHIARDIGYYRGDLVPTDTDTDAPEKRDAPDMVIVLGNDLIVVEAKFFVRFTVSELQAQLKSQKRQVRHLFENRPSLRAWRQVALVPEPMLDHDCDAETLDCDAVITWDDIADLSRSVLGAAHYVTYRLEKAVERYRRDIGEPRVRNYDGRLNFDRMVERSRESGDLIQVGHVGGERDFVRKGLEYARRKRWKWRDPRSNGGVIESANWISGARFTELVDRFSEL
jgi:hypothetical protein